MLPSSIVVGKDHPFVAPGLRGNGATGVVRSRKGCANGRALQRNEDVELVGVSQELSKPGALRCLVTHKVLAIVAVVQDPDVLQECAVAVRAILFRCVRKGHGLHGPGVGIGEHRRIVRVQCQVDRVLHDEHDLLSCKPVVRCIRSFMHLRESYVRCRQLPASAVTTVSQVIGAARDASATSVLRFGEVCVLEQQARGGAELRDQNRLAVPVLQLR